MVGSGEDAGLYIIAGECSSRVPMAPYPLLFKGRSGEDAGSLPVNAEGCYGPYPPRLF
jgi:hypothetical protein